MRSEYAEFEKLGCEVVNIGPDSAEDFRAYWTKHSMPFPGLADPKHVVAKLYGQAVRLLKLGRMPLQLVVDRGGVVRYRHDSNSMKDIPALSEVFAELKRLA